MYAKVVIQVDDIINMTKYYFFELAMYSVHQNIIIIYVLAADCNLII